MRGRSEGIIGENREARIADRTIGAWEGILTTTNLQIIILATIFATIALNILLIFEFNRKLEIQPADVMRKIDERLQVTPKEVMERLDRIEREHMNYVNEYRKLHAKE